MEDSSHRLNKSKYFDTNNHLNETAILICVNALITQKKTNPQADIDLEQLNIPKDIIDHIKQCDQCRSEVLRFYFYKTESAFFDSDNFD